MIIYLGKVGGDRDEERSENEGDIPSGTPGPRGFLGAAWSCEAAAVGKGKGRMNMLPLETRFGNTLVFVLKALG